MKKSFFACFLLFPALSTRCQARVVDLSSPPTQVLALAENLVTATQKSQSTADLLSQIAGLEPAVLVEALSTDKHKKAFWINLYNGFTRVALLAQPEDYQHRGKFFGRRRWVVAGQNLSLDDIEHGILRKNQYKYGLGHVPQIFPLRFNKQQAVQKRDYRIHFALNCGARSCPPVLAYSVDQVDKRLDLATQNYLQTESHRDSTKNTVYVPKLLSWFKGDFGGKKGIRNLLQKNAVPCLPGDRIKFKDYDWTLQL